MKTATLLGTTVSWPVLVRELLLVLCVGAGFCQCIATNPMEITKIRMQVQATLPKEERVGLIQGMSFFILSYSSV